MRSRSCNNKQILFRRIRGLLIFDKFSHNASPLDIKKNTVDFSLMQTHTPNKPFLLVTLIDLRSFEGSSTRIGAWDFDLIKGENEFEVHS